MPTPTPLPEGVELVETERGGDLTAHMPGQLVVYPIFKLDGATTFCGRNDVDGFLRSLEQVVIDLDRTIAQIRSIPTARTTSPRR
jgi:lipoate-protein ligase B